MAEIVLSSEYSVLPDSSVFADILGPETTQLCEEKQVGVRVCRLPDLWLPSGQIVACDSFILDGTPFTRRVKPGKYPLVLAIAIYTDDERIAFAEIQFSQKPVAMWEMAITAGQDITKLGFDEMYGYGVDSGTGSFADPAHRNCSLKRHVMTIRFLTAYPLKWKRSISTPVVGFMSVRRMARRLCFPPASATASTHLTLGWTKRVRLLLLSPILGLSIGSDPNGHCAWIVRHQLPAPTC